jgi:hypothetical protein
MDRRKFLIGLGSLAAGGAAASGTGAFTAARLGRNGDVGVVTDEKAYIKLDEGGAPGADERLTVDGGELQIDFDGNGAGGSGVNDDSRYQIGAMDDDASGTDVGFESLYDDDTTPAAAGAGTPFVPSDQPGYSGSDEDQSAFVVRNQSGQTLDIQIGYELTNNDDDGDSNADDDGAVLYLQGHASAIAESGGPSDDNTRTDDAVATSAIEFDETTDSPDNEQALSFQEGNVSGNEGIPAGEAIYVSLQVDTRGAEGTPDLSGNLVVSADVAANPSTGG